MELTIQNFKKLNLEFRKNKNLIGSNLTSVLLGEVGNKLKKSTKETEGDLILSFLTKMKTSINEIDTEETQKELELLDSWTPSMMTPDEIEDYILKNHQKSLVPNKGRLIGMVVKELKGKALGKDISNVIKSL